MSKAQDNKAQDNKTASVTIAHNPVKVFPVAEIIIRPENNARLKMSGEAWEKSTDELAADIRRNKLLQNPVVRETPEGPVLLAGFRRLAAIKKLKWTDVPCTVVTPRDESEAMIQNLAENVGRQDLTGYELACAVHRLASNYGLSGSKIANRLSGVSKAYINNLLRVMKNVIPQIIKEWSQDNAACTTDFLVKLAKHDGTTQEGRAAQIDMWERATGEVKKGGKSRDVSGGDKDDKPRRASRDHLAALLAHILENGVSGTKAQDIAAAIIRFDLGETDDVQAGKFHWMPPAAAKEKKAESDAA